MRLEDTLGFFPEISKLSTQQGAHDETKDHATESLRGPREIPQGGLTHEACKIFAAARQADPGKDRQAIAGVMAKVPFSKEHFCHDFGQLGFRAANFGASRF